jgi:pimeloyl-ACP methyl ester carboxylesterase
VLVHGLASYALLWEPVATRLAAAGHAVVAIDLRGHGQSEQATTGYDTQTCAADVNALIEEVGWTERPIICGQSWGAHVALEAAAADTAAGVVCVDGGWIALSANFSTFDECWQTLAPPDFTNARFADVRGWIEKLTGDWPAGSVDLVMGNLEEVAGGGVRNRLTREHHRDILRSMWDESLADPSPLLRVTVPALLIVAGEPDGTQKAQLVEGMAALLREPRIEWFPDAHHDIHAQQPERITKLLLQFAGSLEDGRG